MSFAASSFRPMATYAKCPSEVFTVDDSLSFYHCILSEVVNISQSVVECRLRQSSVLPRSKTCR